MGWRAEIALRQGIQLTYHHYLRTAAKQQVMPLA
jgi:hypothetical protein